MDKIERFTNEEFAYSLAELAKDLIVKSKATPHDANRRATLLGGQSGAGKSTLHHILRKQLAFDVIIINGDEYRKLHPRFTLLKAKYGDAWVEHTAKWSGKMTEGLIDELSKIGYNLVIEGTLRTSTVPMNTATMLRERGYSVDLALMAVKPEISLASCQIRHEEMRIAGTTPRATDPAHHAKIVDEIVNNLANLEDSGLFDTVYLYTRSEELLYPIEGKTAAEVLRERLFGAWTDEEREHFEHLQQKLESLKAL